jgi:hypothetical protein
MAFTQEDLAALAQMVGQTVDQKLQAHAASQPQGQNAPATDPKKDYTRLAGVPDTDPTAGPTYYVHLANGDVIETQDSGATHMTVDGETVAVIGRYQKDSETEYPPAQPVAGQYPPAANQPVVPGTPAQYPTVR